MSEISCSWLCALRTIVSMAAKRRSAVSRRIAQHVSPSENGVERGSQLVRERRQELVFDPAGFLRFGPRDSRFVGLALSGREQRGVVERRRRARGDGFDQPYVGLAERAAAGAPKRDRAKQLAVTEEGADHAAPRPEAVEDRLESLRS